MSTLSRLKRERGGRKRSIKYSRRVGENEKSLKRCETFYCGE
jgi:hypothetical protein